MKIRMTSKEHRKELVDIFWTDVVPRFLKQMRKFLRRTSCLETYLVLSSESLNIEMEDTPISVSRVPC